MDRITRRRFVSLLGASAALSVLSPALARAGPSYYVFWTKYWKSRATGTVNKVGSGQVGPFSTRREAQSRVDWYNGRNYPDKNDRGYYYYIAKVI
jgi:hypothetical protein